LIYRKLAPQRTHSLYLLLEMCAKLDPSFWELANAIEVLNPYAVDIRYPEADISIDRQEIVKAIEWADKVYQFVSARLK
jgi:HEPN domain-containing protein